MKKFTDLSHNNTQKISNTMENSQPSYSIIEEKVKKLISSLHVDVEGVNEPWVNNITISESANFRKELTDLVNLVFYQEKKELFEKAHKAIVTRDIAFITEQLDALTESKKKNLQ